MEKEILDINDISELIGRSPKAIRIAMSRNQEGITVPPSTKIGSRRVWMRQVVVHWCDSIVAKTLEEHKQRKVTKTERFVTFCFKWFQFDTLERTKFKQIFPQKEFLQAVLAIK